MDRLAERAARITERFMFEERAATEEEEDDRRWRPRDVRAIILALVREVDRRGRWDVAFRVSSPVDVCFSVLRELRPPRRVLEHLASVTLERICEIHGD